MSLEFHKHLLDHRHYLGVRTEYPHELYCDYCGDYQYNADFDDMVGRKRIRAIPRQSESNRAGGMSSSSLGGSLSNQTLSNMSVSSPAKSQQGDISVLVDSEEKRGGGAPHVSSVEEEAKNMERYKTMLEHPLSGYQPRGITNMGATCFMSSVLQVMLHIHAVRSALQKSLPFDAKGPILLSHSRCMKRDVEAKLRAQLGNERERGAMLMASQGLSSSSQPPAPYLASSSASGGSGGAGSSSVPAKANGAEAAGKTASWREESKAGVETGIGFVEVGVKSLDGAATATTTRGDDIGPTVLSQTLTETSTNSAQMSQGSSPGMEMGNGSSHLHGVLPNAAVTHGCIPCELRALFVESLEGLQAVEPSSSSSKAAAGVATTNHSQSSSLSSSISTAESAVVVTTKQFKRQYPPLVPSKLLYSVWAFADHMAGYEQQDAHEFFIAFLDGIETHLKLYHPPARPSGDGGKRGKNKNKEECHAPAYKVLTDTFSGKLESEVQCEECSSISSTVEPFLDISLSLDVGNTDKAHANNLELQSCLTAFTAPERLSTPIFCECCKENRISVKKLSIMEPPQVLAMHLKRFDAVSQRKVHTRVTFPVEELDIGPFMQSQRNQKPSRARAGAGAKAGADGAVRYSLAGVITHKGSLNSGHYISYVKTEVEKQQAQGQGGKGVVSGGGVSVQQWLRCDDETVTAVTTDEVRNTEGYILFYVAK